jgi:hypothetical protein
MSLVENDPLYVYTQQSVEEVITSYLETIWGPLLSYLQELYSPPISLTGCLPPAALPENFLCPPPRHVKYQRIPYSVSSTPEYEYLSKFCDADIKGGSVTTLTISLPKDPNHPWWERPSTLGIMKSSLPARDVVTFKVTRWGYLHHYSDYHATLRAIDIIHTIRQRTIPPNLTPPAVSTDCEALKLGKRLQEIWLHSLIPDFDSLQLDFPNLAPLIQYYQVSFPLHTTV